MDMERVDLSPLDPAEERLRYERLVRRILDAADAELDRRAREAGTLAMVAAWARPAVAAAAVVAAVALGSLSAIQRHAAPTRDSMVDALGVPAPAAEWLEHEREPSAEDLVLALERRR